MAYIFELQINFFLFQKYRLSDTSTPSPSEEYKTFSPGFYRHNLAYSNDAYVLENGDKLPSKKSPGVDNEGFENDEVFTLTRSPPKFGERTKPRDWREESARSVEEPKQTSWDKRGLIVLGVVTVLACLVAIAVILYFKVFKEDGKNYF